MLQDIRNFIDEAPDGVILFSLGSWILAKDVSNDTKEVFVRTFARLSQRVIFKFDDEIENLPSNVLRLNWLPQLEILGFSQAYPPLSAIRFK